MTFFFKYLSYYFWLCWVLLRCAGFLWSLRAVANFHCCPRASHHSVLWSTGSRVCGPQQLKHVGSKVAASRFRCSAACGIFSDQGLNPCPLHWQADSYPLYLQGRSPAMTFYIQTRENSINLKVLGVFFFFFNYSTLFTVEYLFWLDI